jgi:hypothetical protein
MVSDMLIDDYVLGDRLLENIRLVEEESDEKFCEEFYGRYLI